MYLVNNFEDPFEKSITPMSDSLVMSEKTWLKIHSLREQFTGKFIELYAKRASEVEVIGAYEYKCLVDKIITLFLGKEEIMSQSESKCIQYCENHFKYLIPTLHGLLKPEYRSTQGRIDEIERNSID